MATRDTLSPQEAKCSGGADCAALALQALQEPADAAYAKELMDRVADDCQFTKDLAACAIVYKALGDQPRAEELLGTAEDYCMSGEEQVALAEAKFKVLGDKAAAIAAYEKALKETNNLDPLIELAKNVMAVIGDSAFAKKVLGKPKPKCRAPSNSASSPARLPGRYKIRNTPQLFLTRRLISCPACRIC